MFSRNSPNETRISPRSTIRRTLERSSSARARSCTAVTVPSSSSMIGPSMVSQTPIAVAFPGYSSFTWVPMAMKFWSSTIVAGLIAHAASPVVRARP